MSFSEEQLVQMVQDFMESGSPETTPGCNSCTPAFSLHQHTFLALEGLLACATDVEMELFEKAARYVLDMGSEGRSSVRKRLTMRLRMDGYNASLCRSSWVSTLECPGGDYEYVDVLVEAKKGGGAPRRIIVDVDFRSQFELARPTATYARLSGTLPPIFVGAEEKLRRIIPLLCAAAQESLRERGLHVPHGGAPPTCSPSGCPTAARSPPSRCTVQRRWTRSDPTVTARSKGANTAVLLGGLEGLPSPCSSLT
ncbi:unnamed protein product [Spirodela intermedia]|uniref:Uncharacterized protein n=1 Tax=Spirodela intermedia TaxID=51605 RepID=A0A7I8IS00_SPIIN|nr:unnamed protein product [Spirodela intermedia]CAA6660336.1 unnamed protein product [Spirodela intermedia]